MPRRISDRFAEDATLIRQSAGARNSDGVFVPGVETQLPIRVATAPMSSATAGSEVRDVMPGGARSAERRRFWIDGTEVEALRRGAAHTDSDFIVYRDQMFRVTGVADWAPHSFVEVIGVVPDADDTSVPQGADSLLTAPVIFPMEIIGGVPVVGFFDAPQGSVTSIDTLLPRSQIASYHTVAFTAIFPVFVQLVSVAYLLTHDGLDIALSQSLGAHRITLHVELVDTLVLRFDLTRSETDVGQFQIRGIG